MHTTLRLQHHHSLSTITLAVQIPVSLLLGISKASRSDGVPHDDDQSLWVRWLQDGEMAWMSQVVSGCTEGLLLLVLCLYLYFARSKFARGDLDGDEEAEEEYITSLSMGEETPLLRGWDRNDLQTSRGYGR